MIAQLAANTAGFKILVCLRYPRDGLVSTYHSFTKNHGSIPEQVRAKRLKQGIGSFVIAREIFERDGRQIIDCTPNGACTVFEKGSFIELSQ